ncbi:MULTISPECIES: alpha/beta hydrolase [Thermomonosporaceae]|uniref:alpha/beta hydrolase n=1 Tax=Thermomonosporaceae TaxID=2012 RepID=UPI00255A8282|nr:MULTISPECIES: alpha/beta hydrolase [Thermomonosporaceae]MDL4773124.1 alpha/beta hydrolase [Actinomadura xylanilytica]
MAVGGLAVAAAGTMAAVGGLVLTGPSAVTGSLAASSGGAAAPSGGGTSASSIKWEPCENGAECATLPVPVDWAHPDGQKFGLALARRKATDPKARVGTLVFGPGGPGDVGAGRVVENPDRFSKEIQRRFDIVGLDPRGVGKSNPVVCSTTLLAARPSPLMTGQADFEATVAYNNELRKDCRARTGPLADHVDTLSMVQDLEALRKALGEGRLNFHGSSYGTLLGEQYAEKYPGRIRAMLLESVVDHSLPNARQFLKTQAATAQDSFDEFVKWCASDTGCALHGRDVRALMADLRAKAERGELTDPSNPAKKVQPVQLVEKVFRKLYGPDYQAIATYLAGFDAARPAERPAGRTASAPAEQPVKAAEATTADPFLSVFCSDWSLPARNYREYAANARVMARTAPDLPYTRPLLAAAGCLGAPQPVSNPQHRLKVRGSAPILLVNGLHDPASGYAWATNAAKQMGRSGRLLTYEGAGHGSARSGPCMESATDAYLVSLTLPANGARCPAVSS